MPIAHKATGTNLALVSVGAALIAASTLWGGYQMPTGVPITLQTLGVLLAGSVLGAYRGAAAVLVYLALGTAGLPVWAGHIGGAQVWTGTHAGFLVSFVVAAFVTGWMAERLAARNRATFTSLLGTTIVGALGVITVLGWAYVSWRASMSFDDTMVALSRYLPGDILKAFVAAAVASAVHAAYPSIFSPTTADRLPTLPDPSPKTTASSGSTRAR